MIIVKIDALHNGAHQNQTGEFSSIPTGWASIPDNMEIPATFPFVDITVDGDTVTSVTAREVPPQPEPTPALPSPLEQLRADVDFIALMQGVTL